MRSALVKVNKVLAGRLIEMDDKTFRFIYEENYQGAPVSLTMPITKRIYDFRYFPAFFEGLLPEGAQLEALLRQCKIDKSDHFSQLLQVGADVVGAVTIENVP